MTHSHRANRSPSSGTINTFAAPSRRASRTLRTSRVSIAASAASRTDRSTSAPSRRSVASSIDSPSSTPHSGTLAGVCTSYTYRVPFSTPANIGRPPVSSPRMQPSVAAHRASSRVHIVAPAVRFCNPADMPMPVSAMALQRGGIHR